MKTRLHLFVLAFVSLALHAAENKPASRPNILWLIAEDFGPHLGCYGTKQVSTPILDRLAAEGVRYTHAYTTAPVCSPSRSAFMTGMYATTIGVHNHRTLDKKPLPEGVRLLTHWMKDAGYFTANVAQLPASLGFKGTGKTDWNFSFTGPAFDSRNWNDLRTNQPFFAQINFQETQYPMWNLMKELHAAGKLTPVQEFLCQPRQLEEELYDLETDPHQIRNLAASKAPADIAILTRFRTVLAKWIVETDDQGRFPEKRAAVQPKP